MRVESRNASAIGWFAEDAGELPGLPPCDADAFAHAVILAICQAGLSDWEGRRLFRRCRSAIDAGVTVRTVFRHAGKAAAIDRIWHDRERLFADFRKAGDRREALAALPWIGAVTADRLAEQFGIPDASVTPEPIEVAPVFPCTMSGGKAGARNRSSDEIDEVRHAEAA